MPDARSPDGRAQSATENVEKMAFYNTIRNCWRFVDARRASVESAVRSNSGRQGMRDLTCRGVMPSPCVSLGMLGNAPEGGSNGWLVPQSRAVRR